MVFVSFSIKIPIFEVGKYWRVYLLSFSFISKLNEAGSMSFSFRWIPKAYYIAS